jgi:hypothetical protein
LAGHVGGDDEDGRADHGSGNDHGAVKQAEAAAETARACFLEIGRSFGIGRKIPPAEKTDDTTAVGQ